MELWVRTQNKKQLIKCENIYIDNVGYISQTYYINADSIRLGEYKTEERALEVLNEIQNIIKPRSDIFQHEIIKDINPLTKVYEMPEE